MSSVMLWIRGCSLELILFPKLVSVTIFLARVILWLLCVLSYTRVLAKRLFHWTIFSLRNLWMVPSTWHGGRDGCKDDLRSHLFLFYETLPVDSTFI